MVAAASDTGDRTAVNALQVQLILVAVLLLANAAFAGSEIALISLRQAQIDRLAQRGRAGRTLAKLAEDPNEFLATVQVGITLAGFLASATAATSFADELAPSLGFLGGAARPVAIVAVTMLLTFLTLVVGELAPKRIAMARAERWALLAARPLRWLGAASRPVVWLLGVSTDAVVRLAGVRPGEAKEDVSDEELRDLLLSRAGFHRQRDILEGALDVGDRVLREILVPRRNVTTVPPDATVAQAIAVLRAAGRSRAPLCEDLDRVLGVVHLNDLAGADGAARDLTREALYLPETLPVLDALRALQHERQSLAVVVDEYGGGAGIVTLEDVLEEIVGEIYDEFDRDHQAVVREADGSILLDGTFPLHELADIGVELPDIDVTTVAGVLLEQLGRVPAAGEEVTVGDWRLRAVAVDERAVQRVRLTPRPGEVGEDPPVS